MGRGDGNSANAINDEESLNESKDHEDEDDAMLA